MAGDYTANDYAAAGERQARRSRQNSDYRNGAWLSEPDRRKFSLGLGWFSVALGFAEIAAPGALAEIIGIRKRKPLLRLLGAREFLNGVGILSSPMSPGWLWGRVVGDVLDLSLLGLALANANGTRARIAAATAAVVGVTAADVLCGIESTRASDGRVMRTEDGEVIAKATISVNRPPDELYKFCRDFQNLPRFMSHVESVTPVRDKRWRWKATAPGGRTLEWDSEIINDEPNKLLAWRTLPDAALEGSGHVSFELAPKGEGAIVKTEMRLRSAGPAMAAGAILGGLSEHRLKEDLRRFKQLMETGEIATIAGQPSGRPTRSEIY
jgi:uncharacterized membrane protein